MRKNITHQRGRNNGLLKRYLLNTTNGVHQHHQSSQTNSALWFDLWGDGGGVGCVFFLVLESQILKIAFSTKIKFGFLDE